MDPAKEIIKNIIEMSGQYPSYVIFTDWVKCSALSICNACQISHNEAWQSREQLYLDTAKRYAKEELNRFAYMLARLTDALENKMEDVLGRVYMEGNMGSRAAGQFFTPYHLSQLCAKISCPQPDEDGIYRIAEPSCGGGGMIIAAAEALRDSGVDYRRRMEVVAQDLDWAGVYMTYLQLSLLGIRALCVQGNTLSDPYHPRKTEARRILATPAKMGVVW